MKRPPETVKRQKLWHGRSKLPTWRPRTVYRVSAKQFLAALDNQIRVQSPIPGLVLGSLKYFWRGACGAPYESRGARGAPYESRGARGAPHEARGPITKSFLEIIYNFSFSFINHHYFNAMTSTFCP